MAYQMSTADEILANIINWGRKEEPIRALILVGSRARKVPTDELADFDVSVFTETHRPYTQDDTWLSNIGEVWVCIPEKYYRGNEVIPTRLAIFKGGIKVDFAFLPGNILAEMVNSDELDMGYKVLLDKDGATEKMKEPAFQSSRRGKPTEKDFINLVNEFWFEAYHVAKYLKRQELWLVKFRDWTTKELLLKIIEWHEQAKHNWDYNTWFMGKHMSSWVDASIWKSLHETFAHFDSDDSWRGLLATISLFRQLATEIADMLGFAYPNDVDRNITGFILNIREEQ